MTEGEELVVERLKGFKKKPLGTWDMVATITRNSKLK